MEQNTLFCSLNKNKQKPRCAKYIRHAKQIKNDEIKGSFDSICPFILPQHTFLEIRLLVFLGIVHEENDRDSKVSEPDILSKLVFYLKWAENLKKLSLLIADSNAKLKILLFSIVLR